MSSTPQIVAVEGREALAAIHQLLEEYWESFGFAPCFQNFSSELAGLPGVYAPPSGRLAIVWVAGQPAGCIALRPLDARRAEPKRLYVRPSFRGHGLGRILLDWVIEQARNAGYKELIGDTMPVMKEALAMYDRMGFERVATQREQTPNSPIGIRLLL